VSARARRKQQTGTGWYSVRLLIRCTGKGQPRKLSLYEDRIVVLRARSHVEAQRKAQRIVAKNETPYKNSQGNTVRWIVFKVYESVELFKDEFEDGRPKDGAQIYWRYIRAANPVNKLKRDGTMNTLF
jgi:hypothetical protein